jgi:hypothetical protein
VPFFWREPAGARIFGKRVYTLLSGEFATHCVVQPLRSGFAPSGQASGFAVGAADRPTRDHFRGANVGKLFVGITGSEGPIPHIKLDTG